MELEEALKKLGDNLDELEKINNKIARLGTKAMYCGLAAAALLGYTLGGTIQKKIDNPAKYKPTLHTQNVMGDQRPEKFYIIKGPDGKDITAFLEIDGKPVEEYFVNKPYVGPVEKE